MPQADTLATVPAAIVAGARLAPVMGLAVALGIGLLIGLERERRKGDGIDRGPAGIRTFALVALVGGLSALLPGPGTFLVAAGFIGAFAVASYLRSASSDPGLTTEVALVATFLLGGLALREPALASGVGVVVAGLLAARTWLHRFVRTWLTEDEVHDGLVLAAAALVILPLTPDQGYGPLGAINPRKLWGLVVLVCAISGLGHVAVRVLGGRTGLALAGLAGGFVSSTATIGSLGARARNEPAIRRAAVAGAILSTLATVLQLVVVLAATSAATLRVLTPSLIAAGTMAVVIGVLVSWRAASGPRAGGAARAAERSERAFELKRAISFAVVVGVVLLVSALVTGWLGQPGTLVAAGLSGFADVHAASIAVASLVAAGRLAPGEAVLPILVAFTTNTVSKSIFAFTGGGMRYALVVVPGLLLVAAAAWAAWLLTGA